MTIDLNADLGEGGSEDEVLLGLVSSVNIACGGHAGDDSTMRRTVELAKARGVAVGAHPSYEDREFFGRRPMHLPAEEITNLVRRQVEKLAAIAGELGVKLHHVKPHGALYNQANQDPELAAAVVRGIVAISQGLILYAPPVGELAEAGRRAGLTVWAEGFADRRYLPDGSLMPRSLPGAVIEDVAEAVGQALAMIQSGKVETVCVHGDGTTATAILQALRERLGR